MKVILMGCEYAGKTVLSRKISEWMVKVFGGEPWGPPHYAWHDHYQMPNITHHDLTDDEQRQIFALSPRVKEELQRHNIAYHTPTERSDGHYLVIGLHLDDAVYGPLYFGYGGDGEHGDRSVVSQSVERAIMRYAPDTVLVLVKASPEVVRKRMRETPHANGVLREKDIELVLQRFEDEYARALLRRRFTVDTSAATAEETLSEFVKRYEHHMGEEDRRRILLHREWQAADPLGA